MLECLSCIDMSHPNKQICKHYAWKALGLQSTCIVQATPGYTIETTILATI